jgi:uncharacterized protein YciI
LSATYVILLQLAPAFADHLARPGVMDAIREAASRDRAPAVETLAALGLPADFIAVFVERMGYLLRLRQEGVLLSAGPFADLQEGMYVCRAADEQAARGIMEDDPLYRAGFIKADFIVRRWLAAL